MTPHSTTKKATLAIFSILFQLIAPTLLAGPLDEMEEGTFREVEGGIFMLDYPMNQAIGNLARKAGYRYFDNASLKGENYNITGHLKKGNPLNHIETIAFRYGCTVFYKDKTIYLLTQEDLANVPRREVIWKVRYIPDDKIEPTIKVLKKEMTAVYSRIDYAPDTQQLIIQGKIGEVGKVLDQLNYLDSPTTDPVRHRLVPNTFRQTIFIEATPEVVWLALTKAKVSDKYHIHPLTTLIQRSGGVITYGDETISGQVATWTPNEKFSHTFKHKAHPNEPVSTVSYTLRPIGQKVTKLTLLHQGFEQDSEAFADVTSDWPIILSRLKTLLETGKVLPLPDPQSDGAPVKQEKK